MKKYLLLLAAAALSFAAASDPECSRGLLDWNKQTCCPKYCGTCGGDGCETRPGGRYECCAEEVVKRSQQCSTSEAPCKMAAADAGPGAEADSSVQRPVSIAMMPGNPNKDMFSRMRSYNVKVDTVLIYQDVRSLSWIYLKNMLNTGLQITLVLEFHDTYPNLWDIAGGKYDRKLKDFFHQVKQDGRFVTVRMLHEFNGDWYNWGIFRGGSNSLNAYKAAFRHVSGVIRGTGARIKIQASYNSKNAHNDQTSAGAQYVGDSYLDEVCVSAYNFCGVSQWHKHNTPIGEVIGPWYNSMTSVTWKPLCIAEMSSTNHCSNGKAAWIRATWNSLAYKYTRIRTVTWFLQNNWPKKEDLDLNTQDQIWAWKNGANGFKSAVGYWQGDEVAGDQADSQAEAVALQAVQDYDDELKKKGLQGSKDYVPSAHSEGTGTDGASDQVETQEQQHPTFKEEGV